MSLDLQCGDCGSRELIAVSPGTDPDACDLFALTRGERLQCWCIACWPYLPANAVAVPRIGHRP